MAAEQRGERIKKKLEIDPIRAETVRSIFRLAPRFVTSPVLVGGICFCGLCGKAMTLRTGKGGAYRYYTCCTKARQGATGCEARRREWTCWTRRSSTTSRLAC